MSDPKPSNIHSLSEYSRKKSEPDNEISNENRFQDVRKDVLNILNSATEPEQLSDAKKRWRFSVGMILLSIFVLILSFILPQKDQWLWATAAFIILSIGAWQFDKSNREMAKARRNTHSG